jgi:hypothetical protein
MTRLSGSEQGTGRRAVASGARRQRRYRVDRMAERLDAMFHVSPLGAASMTIGYPPGSSMHSDH